MHKFFVSNDNIYKDTAVIEGEDVKHIYKVLRLKDGEMVSINNCEGKEYLGEIQSVDKREVRIKLLEELDINNESPVRITLYQGLPKSAKMDLIVQKVTEIGVNEITPVITKRVIGLNEISEFSKTERWKRIALEACKQCKRTIVPKVNIPIDFFSLIKNLEEYDLIVVPYENAENAGIKSLLKELKGRVSTIAIVIGPEGGFENEEIELLSTVGAHIITLGPRILRTETAGFVCASILQYELGDMGGKWEEM